MSVLYFNKQASKWWADPSRTYLSRIVGEWLRLAELMVRDAPQLYHNRDWRSDVWVTVRWRLEHNGILTVHIRRTKVSKRLPLDLVLLILLKEAHQDVVFLNLVAQQKHFVVASWATCVSVHPADVETGYTRAFWKGMVGWKMKNLEDLKGCYIGDVSKIVKILDAVSVVNFGHICDR